MTTLTLTLILTLTLTLTNSPPPNPKALLEGGIRGLDLRLSMYEGQIYCSHGVITTSTLCSVLEEVEAFLRRHEREVALVP